ncbi:MAG: flavodoxin domain-containing protein [Armatimonadota bacterium]
MKAVQIKLDIYWVGAVDWNLRDFHGYTTPRGSTYNAYLIKAGKNVLFDTVKKHLVQDHIDHISKIMNPEDIDYIVVNHVEMDHSGSLPQMIDLIKPEKLFCSANGKKNLLAHFGREDWPYEVVDSNTEIDIGGKTIKFIETKMLHWPDSMFSYIPDDKLLISSDAFGQHFATSERFDDEVNLSDLMYEAGRYYANILLLYSGLVKRLLASLEDMNLEIDMIAPDHGLIWRSNIDDILNAYKKWSNFETIDKVVVVYDTMWQSTEKMALAIADGISEEDISVKLMNLQVNDRADVITELLEASAIAIGSSTLNNNILPRVADVTTYLKGLRPQNKIGAVFGSYGWGGESVKHLAEWMEEMKYELAAEPLKVTFVPKEEDLDKCRELGKTIAQAVKNKKMVSV